MTAVLSVEETFEQSAVFGKDGSKYLRTFQVVLDDSYMGPWYAANAGYPIPSPGDVCPVDTDAVVVSCDVKPREGDKNHIFDVTIGYDTAYDNPYDEPVQVQWSTRTWEQEVITDAITGYPIVNSADDLLVPPAKEDRYNLVCTITRNESSFDPAVQGLYCGCVNTDYVWIANLYVAPGCAMVKNISGTWTVKKILGWTWGYWVVTYELEINAASFVNYVEDLGVYYIDLVNGDPDYDYHVTFMDDEGHPADRPKLLDGSGGPLPFGDPPVFLTYYTKPGIALSPLDLYYIVGT